MSRVREATREDVPALIALMTEFYADAGFPLPVEPATRTFEMLLADRRLGRVWLMRDGDVPVGYLVLSIGFSMEFGGLRGFIDDLFVRAPFRGRGLATEALAELRRACDALGVRSLSVEVDPSNDAALSVYRRAGLEDTARMLMTAALAPPVHEA